jgi:hypothetical protein
MALNRKNIAKKMDLARKYVWPPTGAFIFIGTIEGK